MKSYTDLPQSKKLAEILPIESADMRFEYILPRKSDKMLHYPIVGNPIEALEMFNKGYTISGSKPLSLNEYCIPCWSLAALMDVLERGALLKTPQGWVCQSYIDFKAITSDYYSNPVDACVAMIEKLHEQKIL